MRGVEGLDEGIDVDQELLVLATPPRASSLLDGQMMIFGVADVGRLDEPRGDSAYV